MEAGANMASVIISAEEKSAQTAIERSSVEVETQLVAGGLESGPSVSRLDADR